MDKVICTVCQQTINVNYCSNCGQKYVNQKVTLLTLFTDFFDNLFSAEKSFFLNFVYLLLNPKKIILNYLNGYRKYYYSPAKLLGIASVFVLIQYAFNNDFLGVTISANPFRHIFFIVFVVIFVSISGYMVYFKFKKNIIEHFIINIYVVSFWTIIFVLLSFVNYLFKIPVDTFTLLYLFCILIWNSLVFDMSLLKRIFFIVFNFVLFVSFFVGVAFLLGADIEF